MSVLLITCTFFVSYQMKYLKNRDIGYNKEQILVSRLIAESKENYDLLKENFLVIPGVVNVSCCFALPSSIRSSPGSPEFEGKTEDDDWYLLVHTKCKHLGADNRCGIYATRPQICRDYSTDNCEYDDEWCYDRYFETPEQIHEYAEALLQKPGQDIRSPQPAALPVVG